MPPKIRNCSFAMLTPPDSECNLRFNGTGKIVEEGMETLS